MKAELQKLIAAERKHKRELQELRDLRTKIMTHKLPDKTILAMIDDDLRGYLENK